MPVNIEKKSVEHAVNVVLRVPALFIIEAWYRNDPTKFSYRTLTGLESDDASAEFVMHLIYYGVLLLVTSLLLLPVQRLITLYTYLISATLLFVAHHLSGDYVSTELSAPSCLRKALVHLAMQCFLAAVIARLLDWPGPSRLVLLVFAAPVLARIVAGPTSLPAVHSAATAVASVALLLLAYRGVSQVFRDVQIDGATSLAAAAGLLPAEFALFWLGLFTLQLYRYISLDGAASASSDAHKVLGNGWMLALLSAISACCGTPFSLLGLCVSIANMSALVMSATRAWLDAGPGVVPAGYGWVEGITVLLVALQTDIIEMESAQRVLFVSVLLAVGCALLAQSVHKLAAPLMLAAAPRRKKRCLALAMVLTLAPASLAVALLRVFPAEMWLMALTASCTLTAAQAAGSLLRCAVAGDGMDAAVRIAYVATRACELIVSIAVGVCGVWWCVKSGGCSWLSGAVLAGHIHANVWCHIRDDLASLWRRRTARASIAALHIATELQLARHNDACAVCLHEMLSAHSVRTPCMHYFHTECLRRWLYVQDSCPLCHRPISAAAQRAGSETQQPGANQGSAIQQPGVNQESAMEQPVQGIAQTSHISERELRIMQSTAGIVQRIDNIDLSLATNVHNTRSRVR